MMSKKFIFPAVLLIGLSTGCVTRELSDNIDDRVGAKRSQSELYLRKASSRISKDDREKSQEVNLPYIAGKAVPLERSVSLPRPLQKGVNTAVLFQKRRVSLSTAAERIMLATGMIVSIAPDVYISEANLLPKNMLTSGASASRQIPAGVQSFDTSDKPDLPSLTASNFSSVNSSATNSKEPDTPSSFEFPHTEAPLAQILDLISVRLGIRWKYDETNNTIRLYRLVTKTWDTPFTAATSRYSTDFEGATGNSNNTNVVSIRPGISPVGSTIRDLNELASITKSLETVMTKSGIVSANSSSGTIVLTDTADAVEAADRLIRNEIRVLSRVVQFNVQTIQVTSSDNEQNGVDLSAVVNAALQKLPSLSFSTTAPGSLTTSNAGSLNLSVMSGQGNGTNAVLNALAAVGKIQSSTTVPILVRNHKAAYYNVTDTFSYVSATTPGTASLGGGGTPGLTTSQDQVGLRLMMYPIITNTDTVMLTMSLEQSVLQHIESFTSGNGTNQQTVQLPNKTTEGSNSDVAIKNGQTVVITGFNKSIEQFDKRSLGKNVPTILGGSANAKSSKTTTLVIVSVLIKDIDNL